MGKKGEKKMATIKPKVLIEYFRFMHESSKEDPFKPINQARSAILNSPHYEDFSTATGDTYRVQALPGHFVIGAQGLVGDRIPLRVYHFNPDTREATITNGENGTLGKAIGEALRGIKDQNLILATFSRFLDSEWVIENIPR